MDSVHSNLPSRLIDYLLVVGARKPTVDATETPELLRRFPQKDHEDFVLPGDVVFFCQPEGCNTVSKKFSLREANSFAFTLTEKDSGNVRYGICVNVFRPCLNFIPKERTDYKDTKLMVRKRPRYKRDFCMSLTSLCIISHHPFFPTFRECLFFLRKMIDSRTGLTSKLDKNDNIVPGINSWSVFTCTEDQKTSHLASDMDEVETWIQRLLLAQAPVAGRTRVELHLHSPDTYTPLTFALPETNRFPLIDFPIHIPLELLGVETCLKVLTCILLEHKVSQQVVIQSRDYNALTMSVIALTSLLYPLEYMFPVIPLLPTCMNSAEQLLLAPTPFVIGVPASFFRYKCHSLLFNVFFSSQITVPLTADELPPLPQPEGAILTRNLKTALQVLSVPTQAVSNLDESAPLDDPQSLPSDDTDSVMGQLVFGNDIDAVDIAVRVAMVKFFTSPNILGGIKEHTRTLRLFSRPVVALQRGPFLKSRTNMSEFVLLLSESQSLEYYGEWLVYPTNTVFTKIVKGICDPQIIGDKAKWFADKLEPVVYQEPSDSGMPDSVGGSLSSGDSCSVLDDDSEDFSYSVSNPPTPKLSRGLWNSFKKSTVSVTSKPAQTDTAEKAAVNGFAKKITTNPVLDKVSPQEEKAAFFPFPGIRQKPTLPGEKVQGRPPLIKQTSTEKQIQSENQQFLKDILRSIMKGDGVSWFVTKRLRKLMCDESLRAMVANRLYGAPSADKNSDAVDDMLISSVIPPSFLMAQYKQVQSGLSKTSVDSKQDTHNVPKLWWNTLSSFSLGWSSSSSSSSTWSTGTDSTQSPLPGAKRVSRSVFKGMLEILKAVVYGLEVSMENEDIGGIASAFQFLEIAHIHYYGRDIKEEEARMRDDDEMSVISNTDSTISNLSDHSRDMSSIHSWVAETGKRHALLNGKGDRDSGHGEMSDSNSDIETVISSVSHNSEESRFSRERLSRSNSDFAASLSQKEKTALRDRVTRSRSIDQTRSQELARISKEEKLRQERSKNPAIAHMKLNNNMSRRSSIDRTSQISSSVPPNPLLRKSNLNKGFRYYNGDIFPIEDEDGRRSTGRRYLFEGLLAERSSLWDNMDFWENIFLDAVATEREAVGMNQGPAEMIDRYNSLGPAEKKRLEEDEDRLLATMLYNLVAFMTALNVGKDTLKKKNGNDIDLKPAGSRQMLKHSFVVHSGDSMNGDVFFMEVCDDCILLRTGVGAIVERWWYEKLVNITYCPKTKVMCLWCRQKDETILNKFCTKKCKALYFCIKESLQRAADRLSDKGTGVQLGGDFPVKDLSTDEDGHLQVTLEGIGLKFETRRVHIDLCHIRNCSTQGGVFLLEEYGKLGFSCFGAVRLPPRKCEINEHKGMEVVEEVGFEVVVWILLVGSLHVVQPNLLRRPVFVFVRGRFKEFKQHELMSHVKGVRSSRTPRRAYSVSDTRLSPPPLPGVSRMTQH
ncbi:MAP kinase-activating death domain protein [Acropora cervicornis]|uniref:MAP kinase-activating death domain protein n=1 Tax=Acropora cervicornis TaxID=6130 RepID=A0AAD9QXW2_ACRCE|nr:MAP kinase-activating death domain protein [Acropora cervicornis]